MILIFFILPERVIGLPTPLAVNIKRSFSMIISEWWDLSILSGCEIRDPISSLCSSLVLCSLEARSSLLDQIVEAQKRDPEIVQLSQSCRDNDDTSILKDFSLDFFWKSSKN